MKKPMNSQKKMYIVAGAALIIGCLLGNWWTTEKYSIMQVKGFQELQVAYQRIMNNYLNGADEAELLNGAITGMVDSLGDKYSQFLPLEKGEQFVDSYSSNFFGIGAEIKQTNEQFIINSLVKDMPAEKQGLKPNDRIVKVDQEDVTGLTLTELVTKVKGEKGTTVTITVLRGTEELTYNIQRAEIPVYTVKHELLEDSLGYIAISRFAENTDKEFMAAFDDLNKQAMTGLIIDLRSNPGGLVEQTKEIANILVPKGELIYEVVYKDESKRESYVSEQQKPVNIPIVVLVNEYSASASELLAAALKESAGAMVVGQKTYGKGVVQAFNQFRSGSVLSLTEAQWRTPHGEWINEQGVQPTHEVALPDYASLSPMPANTTLQRDDAGEKVELLQKLLAALDYNVEISGLYDEATANAIKQVQQKNELDANSIYTDQVGQAIVVMLQEKLLQEDTQLDAAISLLN